MSHVQKEGKDTENGLKLKICINLMWMKGFHEEKEWLGFGQELEKWNRRHKKWKTKKKRRENIIINHVLYDSLGF